jgi:PKD repeat protein
MTTTMLDSFRYTRTLLLPVFSVMIPLLSVAPIAGAVEPTGSMSTARSEHAAAKLPDGRVLVAGGYSTGGLSTTSVEIYDPATGAFTPASPLVVARSPAGVATLADGRVLVVGGVRQTGSGGESLRSAEIYDPASASWSMTAGSLTGNVSSAYLTTVALPDGNVLVVSSANSQVFHPPSGMFSQAIPLSTWRTSPAAALLPNGRVLLAGGQDSSNAILTSADIWDPATNTWSATNAMATARTGATATRLADGRILIAGGHNGTGKLGSAEVFDPATQTFSATGALATPRSGHSAVALADGGVLVGGGYTNTSVTSSLERYDAVSGTWSNAGTLNASRSRFFTATLLNNGNVLFAGGPGPLATAELYGPDTGNLPPVAGFSHTTSNLTATFTDASSDPDGTIASRFWNFGDGTTSTATNPTKTYAGTGTYNVMLTVTDNAGTSNSITKSITFATPNIAPTANFSFVTNGLAAVFTDSSSDSDGTIASRAWSFGDGTTSTMTNPSKMYAAAGTYSVSLTVTDNRGATHTKTSSVTVVSSACGGTVLCVAVPVTNLSAAAGGTTATYTLVVPAGASNLKFDTYGGTGDADLYVKFGSAPTTTSYDCRPYVGGNTEVCNIANAQAGTYYVVLRAYSAFSGVSLTGTYTTGSGSNIVPTANFSFTTSGLTATFTDTSTDVDGTIATRTWNFGDGTTSTATNPSKTYSIPGTYTVSLTVADNGGATQMKTLPVEVFSGGCGGTILCNGIAVTGLSAGTGLQTQTYRLVVPAGATNLTFVTSGGTGDADLFVKFGSAPTTSSYDCRPYIGGNAETCTITNVQAGTYFVMLRAFSTFSGVSLTGSYTTP